MEESFLFGKILDGIPSFDICLERSCLSYKLDMTKLEGNAYSLKN